LIVVILEGAGIARSMISYNSTLEVKDFEIDPKTYFLTFVRINS